MILGALRSQYCPPTLPPSSCPSSKTGLSSPDDLSRGSRGKFDSPEAPRGFSSVREESGFPWVMFPKRAGKCRRDETKGLRRWIRLMALIVVELAANDNASRW